MEEKRKYTQLKGENALYKERIEQYYLNNVKKMLECPKLLGTQREVLSSYAEASKNRVKKVASYHHSVKNVYKFAIVVKKDLNMVSKHDILQYFKQLSDRGVSKPSIQTILNGLKCFYKWYLGNGETYPDFIKNIKVVGESKKLKIEDLLTEEEIVRMLKACGGKDKEAIMKRAFFMCLIDSGARIVELLSVRLKDVINDDYGYILAVDGKTGYRRIRLTKAVPYLKQWLNIHQAEPSMPLFVNDERYRNSGLSYCSARKIIDGLKKIAKIDKPLHPHALRHRRATEMSMQGFNEKEMNIHFGWTNSSNMAKRYNHTSENEVSSKVLAKEGIIVDVKKNEDLKIKVCPSCGNDVLPHDDFCGCGLRIVERKINDEHMKRDKAESILQGIVNDEELSKEFNLLLRKYFDKGK